MLPVSVPSPKPDESESNFVQPSMAAGPFVGYFEQMATIRRFPAVGEAGKGIASDVVPAATAPALSYAIAIMPSPLL